MGKLYEPNDAGEKRHVILSEDFNNRLIQSIRKDIYDLYELAHKVHGVTF
jgi:hypothetical protein